MTSLTYSGGYKDCCRWIDNPNIRHYYRRTIAVLRNSNAASCKLSCTRNTQCETWYFTSSNKYCYLGAGPTGSFQTSTVYSGGIKQCYMNLKDCRGLSTQFNCCSSVTKCKQGQGDCDYDNDCESGLRCGFNNCRLFNRAAHTAADCCVLPGSDPVFGRSEFGNVTFTESERNDGEDSIQAEKEDDIVPEMEALARLGEEGLEVEDATAERNEEIFEDRERELEP